MFIFLAGVSLTLFLLLSKLRSSKLIANAYKKAAFVYSLLFLVLFFISIYGYLKQKGFYPVSYLDEIQMTLRPNVKLHSEKQNNLSLIKLEYKKSVQVSAPIISQLPELPRGCEVTSLAMLLNSAGVTVDKMHLANIVKKDYTPYRKEGNQVYFGNPNSGFVGNMYTLTEPGYGVYHGPIRELAEKYLPETIIDITGSNISTIKYYLNLGSPVWVITNTLYSELPEDKFESWITPTGPIEITYKLHSVLVTGYDQSYIYFNDPLTNTKNKKAKIADFEAAWVQMGRQAITYYQDVKMKIK